MNFLQVSEPEAAALDAQSYASAQAAQRARTSSNALVSQYGPAAADPAMYQTAVAADAARQMTPLDVAAKTTANATADNSLDQAKQSQDRESQLRAAYALKSAINSGVEAGTAWDTIVAPNASAWGIDPAHAAQLRAHLSQGGPVVSSAAVDALINGLTGPAKPTGEPQLLRDSSGNITQEIVRDDRGGSSTVAAPQGSSFVGPASMQGYAGAPQAEQLPDGSWGYRVFPKTGGSILIRSDGTPVKGMNAVTGQRNEGVRENNSAYGAGPNAPSLATPGAGPGGFTSPMAALADGITTAFPGTRMTSGYRSASANAASDGVPNSAHMSGNAADFHIPAGMTGPQFAAQIKAKFPGATVLYEGPGAANSTAPHVHVQLQPGASQTAPAQAGAAAFGNLPPKGRQMALDAAKGIVNGSQQLASIDDQLGNIDKLVGPFTTGLGSMTAGIPGTPAHNLQAALGTLKAQGLTAWLSSLKSASGSTGIGRVLQSEVGAAQQSFGNLEASQSEDQFRYHLGIFKQRIHQLQSNAEQAFKQQYGADAYSAMGMPAPGADAAPATGHFNYVNGKLVPG